MTDFDRALPRYLVYEGGKVDDPQDAGGRTNEGVTQSTYDAYLRRVGRPHADVWAIPDADVHDIYKLMFWDVVKGDLLPPGLNFAVCDAAINSGCGRAAEWLQASLGITTDGIIGDKTLQAVADHGDIDGLIEEFCSRRLGSLKRLKSWGRYGRGWEARIANVQKTAIAWHDSPPDPIDVKFAGGHMKAPVNDNTISKPPIGQLTTHLATTGAGAATVASQAGEQLQPLENTFAWLKYVCAGLTLAAVVIGIVVKVINDANDAAAKSKATAVVNPDADAGFAAVKVA